MRIVKYFNPNENWRHYSAGSFKFGTLKGYRENELKGDRFSDSGEGTITRTYGNGEGRINDLSIGNIKIDELVLFSPGQAGSQKQKIFNENSTGLTVTHRFNCNVFCATFGSYDRDHHLKMLNGHLGRECCYLGNPALTSFAEIDLSKFLSAIRLWVVRDTIYETIRNEKVEFIRHKHVKYESRTFLHPLGDAHGASVLTPELLEILIFTKPTRYTTEQELRVALTLAPSNRIHLAEDVFPKSDALKKSIIRMGRL